VLGRDAKIAVLPRAPARITIGASPHH
jgi:hypothetical protein